MPTLLRIDGIRIVVYPNDHRPSHVHAIGAGAEAVFNLNCPHGPIALRGSRGFTTTDLNAVVRGLAAALADLCS